MLVVVVGITYLEGNWIVNSVLLQRFVEDFAISLLNLV
jgi:hypothetical protein